MGKETGIKELGGVYVATVSEDGAASAAGIRKGDVIVAIDGVKIDNASAVQEQIAKHRPNDKVKITVKRDGAVKLFDVTLRNKAGKTELITREAVDVTAALGGKFRDAGTKLCQELEIKGGVQVVGIKSNGILARARVKEGFVITHINEHQRSSRLLAQRHGAHERQDNVDRRYLSQRPCGQLHAGRIIRRGRTVRARRARTTASQEDSVTRLSGFREKRESE